MKLRMKDNGRFYVNTSVGSVELSEAAEIIRKNNGFPTASTLQNHLGISHPRYANLESGKSQSVATFLEAMLGLGYEVEIKRKAVEE